MPTAGAPIGSAAAWAAALKELRGDGQLHSAGSTRARTEPRVSCPLMAPHGRFKGRVIRSVKSVAARWVNPKPPPVLFTFRLRNAPVPKADPSSGHSCGNQRCGLPDVTVALKSKRRVR